MIKINDKLKRILAIIAVVILVLMYVVTLVFAITDNAATMSMFKASLAITMIVPIFIYANQLIYRLLKGKSDEGNK